MGLNPTGGMASLHTLVKPLIYIILISCIVVRINKTYIFYSLHRLVQAYMFYILTSGSMSPAAGSFNSLNTIHAYICARACGINKSETDTRITILSTSQHCFDMKTTI